MARASSVRDGFWPPGTAERLGLHPVKQSASVPWQVEGPCPVCGGWLVMGKSTIWHERDNGDCDGERLARAAMAVPLEPVR
jgi:hypothetical protein